MASFLYKGRNARGEAVEGRIDAASAAAVADQLFGNGITPIQISETAAAGEKKEMRWLERRVSMDELIMFTRQMYTLTKAGVPIIRAMGGLIDMAKSPRLKRVLRSIAETLESGRSLADSLRQHPEVFPAIYVSIIQVGENSGRLEESFLQIARHLELDKEMRERVKTAMRYPMMVIGAITIAMAIINLKVIPAFAGVFEKFGAQLPTPTKILLAVSKFTVDYWPLILIAMIGAVVGFIAWARTASGRYRWDRYKLRIPKIGDIVLRATLARFGRSFAMAMRSGVPLIQALTVVSRAVDNDYIGKKLRDMRQGIERGESLTRVSSQAQIFTPLVLQMISVGEETGQVDDMMQEVAEFYEREVEYDLKRLSAYIEPILIGAIGIMVLILALGVFLPMWNLSQVMK